MSIKIGSESQQLLDEIRQLLESGREMKGQVVVSQNDMTTLLRQFRTSLHYVLRGDGSLSQEEPLRSATMAVIRSVEALETEIEDGFPILGRVIVPQAACLEHIDKLNIYLRHVEQIVA